MNQIPYNWSKRVKSSLKDTHLLPEDYNFFSFPWDQAAGVIQNELQLSSLNLIASGQEWQEGSALLHTMEENPSIYAFEIYPLQEKLFLVLSQKDLIRLTSITFLDQGSSSPSLSQIREGFYQFLLLKIVHVLDKLPYFEHFSLRMLPNTPLPQEKSLCIDIACEVNQTLLKARVICPESLINSCKEYGPLENQFLLSSDIRDLELPLSVYGGNVTLTSSEIRSLKMGDFVILDEHSFDPLEKRGELIVKLGKHPLFEMSVHSDSLAPTVHQLIFDTPDPLIDNTQSPLSSEVSLLAAVELELDLDIEKSSSLQEENNSSHLLQNDELVINDRVTWECNLGQWNLSLQTLLALTPGTALECREVHHERITFMQDQQPVATGEMMKLGDLVGVRIVEHLR
ncbi:MAG: FliM/FliN family flagellar motor switch protein [Candidatus Rhabdochlamydia sp.]